MEKKDMSDYMMECYQKIKNTSDEELKELGREICHLHQEGMWPKNSKIVQAFRTLSSNTGLERGYTMSAVKSAIIDEILVRYTKDE